MEPISEQGFLVVKGQSERFAPTFWREEKDAHAEAKKLLPPQTNDPPTSAPSKLILRVVESTLLGIISPKRCGEPEH
jgi:hypothetical protein